MAPTNIQDYKQWLKTHEFSRQPLRLNACAVIEDREKFVMAHVAYLDNPKLKKDKRRYLGYWERLVQYYELVK